MELTERKKKVLQTVVDLYIRTAEPVGSKAIAAMPGMNYSSATIRNELADLTTMGLLLGRRGQRRPAAVLRHYSPGPGGL